LCSNRRPRLTRILSTVRARIRTLRWSRQFASHASSFSTAAKSCRDLIAKWSASAHQLCFARCAAAAPVLVMLTAVGGLWFDEAVWLLPWALCIMTAYAVLVLLARRASREQCDDATANRWRIRFLLIYAVIGLCWALFSFQGCTSCQGDSFTFYKAAVLLIALAATAMATFALRYRYLSGRISGGLGLGAQNRVQPRRKRFFGARDDMRVFALLFIFMSQRLRNTNLKMLGYPDREG
jgi:two-component system cell cycle sensor histidine kinase PleC